MNNDCPETGVSVTFRRLSSWRSVFPFVLLLVATPLFSQQTDPVEQKSDETPSGPLPATEVPLSADQTVAFLRDVNLGSTLPSGIKRIKAQVPVASEQAARLQEYAKTVLVSRASLRELEDLQRSWGRLGDQSRGWQNTVLTHSRQLDGFVAELDQRREIWRTTQQAARTVEYPESVRAMIRESLSNIAETRAKIIDERRDLLQLQNSILEVRTSVAEGVADTESAIDHQWSQLFSFASAPLWSVIARVSPSQLVSTIAGQFRSDRRELAEYLSQERRLLLLDLLFLVLAFSLLTVLRKELSAEIQVDGLKKITHILNRPLASALLVAALLSSLLHSQAPTAWFKLLTLLVVIALIRLLPGLLPAKLVPLLWVFLALRLIDGLTDSFPEASEAGRLLTFSTTVLSGLLLVWFWKSLDCCQDRFWLVLFRAGIWLSALLLGVALLANLFGGVSLAGVLSSGVLRIVLAGTILWAAHLVIRAALMVLLQTRFARRSRVIRLYSDLIQRRISWIVGFALTLYWLFAALSIFLLERSFMGDLLRFSTSPLTVGELSVSIADVVIFVLSVWFSFALARLVTFLLDEDVIPRLTLHRGVGATISRLSYYAVLLVGFLIALSAAGLGLDRFTVIIGAFGVGIGFGLQNIVNNFVSGLILLFERPIQIGDKVQVGELLGEVTKIGTRASTLRTFEGSEVIVPNGDLISGQVINWTLSDLQRRVEVTVGVAYGTDPEKVLQLLLDVAKAHEQVLPKPDSQALFMGFGESSLDFSLRVWIADFDKGFRVRSDLAVAVNRALAEAGIEIPFPQRDLHIRSGNQKLE
jgi:small-conductance mechanosensitive channel